MKNKKKTSRRKPFFRFVKCLLRIFVRKPKIINHNQNIEDQAILLSNHEGASGPLTIELYLDHYFVPWGTYEMNGTLKQRWDYLTKIYFPKKKHFNKFLTYFLSIFAVFLLKGYYKGIELISTYQDARIRKTFRQSFERLDKHESILIFPEDSSTGYKEVLEHYFRGFVVLSKLYYKQRQIDLPIYPMYYNKKKKVIIIGQKEYLQNLIKQGLNDEQVAEYFKNKTNDLRNESLQYKKNKR